jgi:hypothetical protein
MLERTSQQMGIEAAVTDSETRELGTNTSIDSIARDLQGTLVEDPKAEGS